MYIKESRRNIHRRNRLDDPLPVFICGGVLAIIVIVIFCVKALNKEKDTAKEFDAEQEANVMLYLPDGGSVSGAELVDTMHKLSATSVSFAVKTLSSDGITYYNRDADGNVVPGYTEPDNKTAPEYIRELGVFEIHISTDGSGRKIVSAVQTG